ncbi:hypothetical protein [Microbulbifer sp.]|uniref:hypothetical protein n=1 Tax=Microbulbifer sp. TaxID=1908541 RepID=UPI003F4197B4
MCINHEVFRLYRFHLNSMVWNLITGGAAGDILAFSPGEPTFDRAPLVHALEDMGAFYR